MLELDIQYCVRGPGERKTSGELVITNYDARSIGGLFNAHDMIE